MKAARLSLRHFVVTTIALLLFVSLPAQVCDVDAGPDTTFCQQQGQLFATPAVPGPNYVFIWSPATGLSDPNAQNPYVVSGVSNQQYIVQMNDSLAGCYTSDTVIVSAYNYSLDTVTVCYFDSMLLDFGPGASFYYWQFFTDTNNVTTPINSNTQTYWATAAGTYTGYATFPVCGTLTSMITIEDPCFGTCSVNAGPDHSNCGNALQLQATAVSPGNDYIFSWSPSNYLLNPNSASASGPFPGPLLVNQPFVVTMTDTMTGCVDTDTVFVSNHTGSTDTFNICGAGDTVILDLGAGTTNWDWISFTDTLGNSSTINHMFQFYQAGQAGLYIGEAVYPGTGCGLVPNYYYVTWCAATCSVDAGPDTIYCQQQGSLSATPGSAGNHIFSWSPSIGLDNPNSQNPNIISGVHNQQYVVTMTDTVTNCVATDTVIVSAYYWTVDTLYMCNAQPISYDIGPGASNYTVQFTDTSGNGQFYAFSNSVYTITQPAQYIFIGTYPGCGALTSVITVIDSCNVYVGNVWPGDCNYDLIVNAADALHIGLAANTSGPVRPNASIGFYPQLMNDWSQNFSNCNYKHADTDGNGLVNANDTLAIALNYSLTHPYRQQAPEELTSASLLKLVCSVDTVGLQTLVQVDVVLGTVPAPVDSLYGISFRITSDAFLIDTTLTAINANTTWLGNAGNMFTFQKHFPSDGITDFAEVKTNHVNTFNGQGVLASYFIVTTDNLSGIQTCHFNLSEVTAVTKSQVYLPVNTENDSVVIDPGAPAGMHEPAQTATFSIYPNPANENISVVTSPDVDVIEICDVTGRVVQSVRPTGSKTLISTSSLAEGMYLVRVKNGNSIVTQKLTIAR